jgi:ketosteroid isomerase-like protein
MRGDPEEVAALFAVDAVLETADRTVVGRDAFVAFYREFLAPMREISLSIDRAYGDEHGVAFEWIGVTTYDDGRTFDARGCDVVTLRDGEITRSLVHIHRITQSASPLASSPPTTNATLETGS